MALRDARHQLVAESTVIYRTSLPKGYLLAPLRVLLTAIAACTFAFCAFVGVLEDQPNSSPTSIGICIFLFCEVTLLIFLLVKEYPIIFTEKGILQSYKAFTWEDIEAYWWVAWLPNYPRIMFALSSTAPKRAHNYLSNSFVQGLGPVHISSKETIEELLHARGKSHREP